MNYSEKEMKIILNALFEDDEELLSDCCGAFTTETEMGICPDCLEHCEFTPAD